MFSPLHIGSRRVGNLQQTRYYLPARTLWGAVTARLTRKTSEAWKENYKGVGGLVDQNLRFSYFYPVAGKDSRLIWPWDNSNGRFEWTFINSQAGSPIENQSRAALDGGLHETEYIMPVGRDGRQVYLLGYVFAREEEAGIAGWREELSRLQLGGDRSYGWGRVSCEKEDVIKAADLFGNKLDLAYRNNNSEAPDGPLVCLEKNEPLLAHVECGKKDTCLSGQVEILAGRLTGQDGQFGRAFAQLQACWQPGSKIMADKQQFCIGPKGIWYPV